MQKPPDVVRVSVDVALEPPAAFDLLVDELRSALRRRGLAFEAGPGGRLTQDGAVVARVVSWRSDEGCGLEVRPASWDPGLQAQVEIRAEAVDGGSRLTVEQRGWSGVVGGAGELVGWFASEVAAGLLGAMTPAALGDWITDRLARRPAGAQSRATYRDPLFHHPNFRAILEDLALTPDDRLLEVGCGGGAFLSLALESGCRAVGVDHSPDMLEVAGEVNERAVAEGRLRLVEGTAESLPLPDAAFTCAVMTGVLGFLEDPVAAVSEIRRVLAPGGRVVIMGTDPELRGTPGAPEPMASRLRFYEEKDLEELGRAAGFEDARAVRRDLERHAREVGIPEEALPLFAGPGARFLLATRT